MRRVVVASLLSLCLGSAAEAQEGSDAWLIVPMRSTVGDSWMEPAASKLRAELLLRGVAVHSLSRAAQDFERSGSRPAAELTQAEQAAWVEQSRGALWHLALGEPEAALAKLTEAQELSLRVIDDLSRDEARAEMALDTCLFLARALLENEFASDANTVARQCRELVPRGEPSLNMHPAPVLKLFKRVEAQRAAQPTTLRIDSLPTGCAARINGQAFGDTPVEVTDLLAGKYRVQVECDPDQRGRVHVVDTSSGSDEIVVDTRFDRAVATAPVLHLRYPDAEAEQRRRLDDLAQIVKAVPAGAVLAMSIPTPRTLVLELFESTSWQRQAFVKIPAGALGPTRGDVALAARALAAGTCTDFTELQPRELLCEDLAPAPEAPPPAKQFSSTSRMPRGRLIPGLTLASLGSASLLTGYVLLAPRARAAEDWVAQLDSGDEPDGVAQQRWLNLGSALTITSSVGAAALVAAMPLALPKQAKTPWWAWVSGGIGVGLAAFSIAYGLTAEDATSTSCSTLTIGSVDAQTCVRKGERVAVAILTGVTSAPLLTIPLVYLFRRDEMRLSPSVEVGAKRGYFSLRGEF